MAAEFSIFKSEWQLFKHVMEKLMTIFQKQKVKAEINKMGKYLELRVFLNMPQERRIDKQISFSAYTLTENDTEIFVFVSLIK